MSSVIDVQQLTKFYGKVRGVEDVTLQVNQGEVFGFLGPNGAGKSTTIRVLLDFIRPTAGHAKVFGIETAADPVAIHRRVGYLPGELSMYDTMTGEELLRYFGSLRGLSDLGEAVDVAERMDLDLSKNIRSYSSGNRQKLGIAQAFMHRPELLILDEPTNGLDPLMQQTFHALVAEAREAGRTVFLSSHVLPEVERVADRVAIIRDGRLVTVASIAELKAKAVHRVELRFADPVREDDFASVAGVRSVSAAADGRALHVSVEGSVDALIKRAAQHEVVNLVSHEGDLEEAFLAFYSGPEATNAQ